MIREWQKETGNMKYLKTYESLRQDFDKEMKEDKQKSIDLINKTKETVDEYMFSLTDSYNNPNAIDKIVNPMNRAEAINWTNGIQINDEPVFYLIKHSDWDGQSDITQWYHNRRTSGLSKRIDVQSLFLIKYDLRCKFSADDSGYRLYEERDELDDFIDELESTLERIKEVLGLEYRLKAKYLVDSSTSIPGNPYSYHEHNHDNYSDLILLKGELGYQKEVDSYQKEKNGKPNGSGYSYVEIAVELV